MLVFSLKYYFALSGHNSMVEYQLPKLNVAGSIPVARFLYFNSFKMESVPIFVMMITLTLDSFHHRLELYHP